MAPSLSSKEFTLLQKFFEAQCGISMGEDKAYLIESRLSKLLIDSGLSTFEELYEKILNKSNPIIAEKVIDAITTNETLWFRDKTPWDILENVFMPKYISELREGRKFSIRIWSAACSTGQEPYSTAMFIDNYLSKNGISDISLSKFEIIATDISNTVLQVAKQGKYDNISITRGLDPCLKQKYFTNDGRVWAIDEKIKNAVRFQHFNLQNSFIPLGTFDAIFCRYVIIYFSEQLRREMMQKLAASLHPAGALFIGNSELLNDYSSLYTLEEYKTGVYYIPKG